MSNDPISNMMQVARRPRRPNALPLSYAQQRLWFLEQLLPGSPLFNVTLIIRLAGHLDLDALAWSLSEIVRRHEVLRTTFTDLRGEPVQVVGEPWTVDLEQTLVDLRSAAALSEREDLAKKLVTEEALVPFNLSEGPLIRFLLLRLDEDLHILSAGMHHITTDRWSLGVFFRELSVLYDSRASGRPYPLSELPIQYADYAYEQRQRQNEAVLVGQVDFWSRQLVGPLPLLRLPLDRPSPDVSWHAGDAVEVDLNPQLVQRLRILAGESNATLFMVLHAAFAFLLCCHSRQTDIVIGTDVANRHHPDVEKLLGFFVNQLVLRTDLSGNPTFRELIARVRDTDIRCFTHQDFPFAKLVELLNPKRKLEVSPLFQVKFVFHNMPQLTLTLDKLEVEFWRAPTHLVQHDLVLLLHRDNERLSGRFEYSTGVFDPGTIARMRDAFVRLLEVVTTSPDEHIITLRDRQRRELMAKPQFKSLKSIKATPVEFLDSDLVTTGRLTNGEAGDKSPLVIRPAVAGLDLLDWAANNREYIDSLLLDNGALLFRGFNIDLELHFEAFTGSLCLELLRENAEHDRENLSGAVYTPVFFPPDMKLLWHNENSFNHCWPLKLWFGSVQPSAVGGETTIVDSRKVFNLLDPELRRPFIEKGVMYLRNYSEELGLPWQRVFQTTDKTEVERQCKENRIEFEWKKGDRLQTRGIRPAVCEHPVTGETSWFNQALHWHPACLDPATRQALSRLFNDEDMPRNCYYGDGSPIQDEAMRTILDVYQRLEIAFQWQPGDIMMLDNVMFAHARNPFQGHRRLLVSMGDMRCYNEI